MTLSDLSFSLNLELIVEAPWGGIVRSPQPIWSLDPLTENWQSRPGCMLIHALPDGTFKIHHDVLETDTPDLLASSEGSESFEDLRSLHDAIFEQIVDEQIECETHWDRSDLVKFMWGQGWSARDGKVTHENDHGQEFPNWFEAIKFCLEQASEDL